jgi:hypothetical protein
VKRGLEVWGDTGRVALVPVNTTTCKTTHTLVHRMDFGGLHMGWASKVEGRQEAVTRLQLVFRNQLKLLRLLRRNN